MPTITLHTLGRMLVDRRGERGIRDTAREIGISHATLSRVERGYLPDLETFRKVCEWLEIDPGEVLGIKTAKTAAQTPSVHFRTDQALKPETASALANMIMSAQRALLAMNK